jgi:hypothetical protein
VSSGSSSVSSGSTSPAVSSNSLPVLTAANVQSQIDNSTPTWLGKFETVILSAIDQRILAANTDMQADMKALRSHAAASDNMLQCWTEKLTYSLDMQAKKTFELGCEMTKMAARVAAMERAAGLPPQCQSANVDLTEVVDTVPRVYSLKRSAETAELTTSSEQRLARVEDALNQIVTRLNTPRSSPSSSPASSSSSPQLSLFTSSPNFYGHYRAPGRPVNHEHQQAFVAGQQEINAVQRYLRDEDRDDFLERRQQRRNGLLGELGLPCAW